MVKVEKHVIKVVKNRHYSVYKTKRAPTRFFYVKNNKRVYLGANEVTKDLEEIIPYIR